MHIVMEYIEGCSLQEKLEKESPLPEADVQRWFAHAARGMEYLHSQDPPVLHLDMKPANLLLCSKTGEVKICDFGTSTFATSLDQAKRGTPLFSAPELQRSRGLPKSTDAGMEADVWSLGATLFYLIFWKRPFADIPGGKKGLDQVHEALRSTPVTVPAEVETLSAGLREILVLMLNNDAEHRALMADIIQHPWVAKTWGAGAPVGLSMDSTGPLLEGATWLGSPQRGELKREEFGAASPMGTSPMEVEGSMAEVGTGRSPPSGVPAPGHYEKEACCATF